MPSETQSSTKTTPGPWRVEGRYVRALKVKDIAEVPSGGVLHGKVDEANAHLIAAAPDLRDALRWAVEWMENYEGETMPEWREWAVRGRAALIKAVQL